MHKLIALLAVASAVAVSAIAAPALAAGTTVKVSDDKFTAKVVHIKKGATVTWKWVGSDSHNVVGKGFRSKTQNKGTFSHRFTKAGTYNYVCTLHVQLGMKGTIVVK